MAYNEDQAQFMRDRLSHLLNPLDLVEKHMFGGLCFMLRGHMLCGVHKGGGMARVGKARENEALRIEGVEPLSFTGRKMGGLVEFEDDFFDDERLDQLITLAVAFNHEQPEK